MPLADHPLLSGRSFRAAMEMATTMPNADVERDPFVLALMLCDAVDQLSGLSELQLDFFHRVLASLVVDWSERLDGGGTESIQILLAVQDTDKLMARVKGMPR